MGHTNVVIFLELAFIAYQSHRPLKFAQRFILAARMHSEYSANFAPQAHNVCALFVLPVQLVPASPVRSPYVQIYFSHSRRQCLPAISTLRALRWSLAFYYFLLCAAEKQFASVYARKFCIELCVCVCVCRAGKFSKRISLELSFGWSYCASLNMHAAEISKSSLTALFYVSLRSIIQLAGSKLCD